METYNSRVSLTARVERDDPKYVARTILSNMIPRLVERGQQAYFGDIFIDYDLITEWVSGDDDFDFWWVMRDTGTSIYNATDIGHYNTAPWHDSERFFVRVTGTVGRYNLWDLSVQEATKAEFDAAFDILTPNQWFLANSE